MIATHVINEPVPGVFETILDAPDDEIIYELVSTDFQWILSWQYEIYSPSSEVWVKRNLPIVNGQKNETIFTRSVSYDLLCETTDFLSIKPNLWGANLTQFNNFPPTYVDFHKIKGNQRFRILSELDWNFLCELTTSERSYLCSPKKQIIEKAIAWTDANYANSQTKI